MKLFYYVRRDQSYMTNNCVGSNKHCLSHSSVCKNNWPQNSTGQSGAGIPETYRDSIFWWASECILTTTSWNENRSSKADLVDKYKVQCVLEQNQKCCGSAINHLVVLPRKVVMILNKPLKKRSHKGKGGFKLSMALLDHLLISGGTYKVSPVFAIWHKNWSNTGDDSFFTFLSKSATNTIIRSHYGNPINIYTGWNPSNFQH